MRIFYHNLDFLLLYWNVAGQILLNVQQCDLHFFLQLDLSPALLSRMILEKYLTESREGRKRKPKILFYYILFDGKLPDIIIDHFLRIFLVGTFILHEVF